MALAETAHLVTTLDLKDGLSSGLANARRNVSAFGRQIDMDVQRVGRGVGQVGRGLGRVGLIAGGVAAAGLGAAAKAAIDFEDAFAGVRKTVDATPAELEKLRKSFLEMSGEIPIAATEFARLGEIAGQLGIRTNDIEEFTRVTALMGVATDMSSDAAADAFGRIATILGLTGKQYRELGDAINAVGNAAAGGESEIAEVTKRFAAEAKAAGLAKEEIVGLAGSVGALGFAPERGGTALSRVFANMGTNIALANGKGKEFASLVGKPIRELQRDLDKGRGLSIFMDVLKAIKGMTPTEANRTLKALGVTNTSDRTIFRAMSDQLPTINKLIKEAEQSTGSLNAEAEKRFAGVKQQFNLLKQNIILAGIEIGEGFAPALGRAAVKLKDWVRANREDLKSMGVQIGEAIDGIDWGRVMGALKTVVNLFREGWEIVRKIPPEITALGLGIVGINKLSGGLLGDGIGNIIGGLGGAATRGLASRMPKVGSVFAQPVFVTNWPMGGMGGGGVVAGAPGAAKGGRFGRLRGGAGLAGLGMMAGMALFGDDIEGAIGQPGSRMMGAAGNIMTGAMFGPIGMAAAAILTAAAEIKGLSDDIGKGQGSNRAKAEGVGGNISEASTNLANMTRLMKETTGFDRTLMSTFNATELGAGLKNASDALLKGIGGPGDQTRAIQQLMEAQTQAQEYGWTQVAEHIGANLEAARRWMPKPETFASAVSKGASQGVAQGIGKGSRNDPDAKALREVAKHLGGITEDPTGKDYGFTRMGDRLSRRVRDALSTTGAKRDEVIRDTIGDLKRAQKRAEDAGATRLARNIGRDITTLRGVLGRKADTTNTRLSTIANKDTSVSVTVPVTTTVSVRDVAQKTTTYSRYGYSAV